MFWKWLDWGRPRVWSCAARGKRPFSLFFLNAHGSFAMKLLTIFGLTLAATTTYGRTLIFKEDHLGDDISVYDSQNGPVLYRVDRKHGLRLGHHATIYDGTTKTPVASYASQPLRLRDVYDIQVEGMSGTMQKSALFSNSFDIDFNGQQIRAKAVKGDNKYVFEDAQTQEQFGSAVYDGSLLGFHRDTWNLEVQSSLPDAFWVDVVAVIHDSEKE